MHLLPADVMTLCDKFCYNGLMNVDVDNCRVGHFFPTHYVGFSYIKYIVNQTRRPASADRTARRQFQATGQPVSQTQASDAIKSRLLRYEAKCVQRRCFQCGSVPLRSDIKGTELPPANIFIPLER